MISLLLLAASAVVPWLVCSILRGIFGSDESGSIPARERALGRYRRATLVSGLLVLPAAAVAGALLVDSSLSTRWPAAGSWFFASLSATTAWVSLALARRTREEAAAMSALQTMGRAVQTASVLILATGLALLAGSAADLLPSLGPIAAALTTALLSVGSVLVLSPWLVIMLGLWPVLPKRIEAGGRQWKLAHLPAPTRFLTHTAALPWLRTVLVSDGLFNGAPERHWENLVRYEIGGALHARSARSSRWTVAVVLSLMAFMVAAALSANDPAMRVATTALAVLFTSTVAWLANRQPSSTLQFDSDGPSMQELAQTLRSLPPRLGQALPRTSCNPLGSALYDRLFALGHDPGRRPQP